MSLCKVLAMDTVFAQGSVALLLGEQVLAHAWLEGPEGHVVGLPCELNRLLAKIGWRCDDIEMIAVTLGPGSFTGSRIALGLAKGFSLALGVPVIGVTTLEVLVAQGKEQVGNGLVAAILDARRKEVYAALYKVAPGTQTVPLLPPALWDPLDLAKELAIVSARSGETMVLTGNGLTVYTDLLRQTLGERFLATDPACWRLDAAILGVMAQSHPAEVAIELLEPLYIRRADAKEREIIVVGVS